MKKIFQILLLFILLIGFSNNCNAQTISEIISESPLDKSSTIAVSIKDTDSGKTIYEYNEKKLLHPASTLKVFTALPALEALGEKYTFKTIFYTYNNDLYLKLGADPFLTSENLKQCIKEIKAQGYKSFKNIYIDDSIIDNVEWGVGWMWDDGTNSLMQKFSAYNIDNNTINLTITKNSNGITITPSSSYSLPVLNTVKAGNKNDLYTVRHDWISPDIVCVSGTISGNSNIKVPINNMKRYFENRLFNYLDRSNIKIENKTCLNKKVPENAKKVSMSAHFASTTMGNILKSSDNRCAETLAKVAGGVKYNTTGNLADQINLFYDFWNENGVDTSGIIISDASGISRNNLITADFMTNALNKLFNIYGADKMKSILAQPGEGTMAQRMLNHRGSLYLKTGTLSNISGITGYVITENGKTYSVAILIQNFIYPMSQIKIFENQLLETIEKM
ncbi:D-alanyl-D-alanine carboxypeptidase/D-alanyl-D-alanine-endopeptidase [bacterium]|nr:D-alanyl-D-alanine carboxypeptidase/D-alanyl-D-alanine-endopeptidase [bacterium]